MLGIIWMHAVFERAAPDPKSKWDIPDWQQLQLDLLPA